MKNLILILVIIVVVTGATIFVGRYRTTSETDKTHTIRIVASFYPLAEFAQHVAGDQAIVTTVVPAGTEPHDYEPTPQDIARIQQATVFIFNGNGLDPWAERIQNELQTRHITVINMSKIIPRTGIPTNDPHSWLDPVIAKSEIAIIRDALAAADPQHADIYQHNASQYITELDDLDNAYQLGLHMCRLRTIVTSHEAFAYLAQRYHFTTISLAGISPDEEPSTQKIAEISRIVQQRGIKYIFFETLVSPRIAQVIAQETGAKTLVFDPIEGISDQQRQAGENYVTIMHQNLKNLQTALGCQ